MSRRGLKSLNGMLPQASTGDWPQHGESGHSSAAGTAVLPYLGRNADVVQADGLQPEEGGQTIQLPGLNPNGEGDPARTGPPETALRSGPPRNGPSQHPFRAGTGGYSTSYSSLFTGMTLRVDGKNDVANRRAVYGPTLERRLLKQALQTHLVCATGHPTRSRIWPDQDKLV